MTHDDALITAIYTLIGGVILYVFSTSINEGFMKPLRAFQQMLGKVDFTLINRANVISSLRYSANPALCEETSAELRELAASLHSQLRDLTLHDEAASLHLIPYKSDVIEAISQLIGLSNTIYNSNDFIERSNMSESIRKCLRLERVV